MISPFLLRKAAAETTPAPASYSLSLDDAEAKTVERSDTLKASLADQRSAVSAADSQFGAVLPRLDFDASYRYVTEVPSLQTVPGGPAIRFGTNSNYSVGPQLSYTWDTGSSWKAYKSLSRLAASREEDRKSAERQLRLSARAAYIGVQLALEEMRVVNDFLALSRAQSQDISTNYKNGAASRLDLVDSKRQVLNDELQFRQRQAALSSALKDLLALVGESPADVSHPGPPGVENVTLELKLDSLDQSLGEALSEPLLPPDESHPQIRSQELRAQSAELSAQSQKAALFPVIQGSAKASEDYPNAILPKTVRQNTFALSLSLPLFEGKRTRRVVEEKLLEAEASRRRAAQLRTDLGRDFWKATDLLNSLREQKALAADDVQESEEAAKLYYESYKLGKINLIDVQGADVRALQAKVDSAGISAQILQQIAVLRALSGGAQPQQEPRHAQ